MLIVEIKSGALSNRLADERTAVRTLAGTGFTEVGGSTADEVIAGLRANAQSLTFADETGLAYHVNKHADELLEAELPAADAARGAKLAAYVGGARRTVKDEVAGGGERRKIVALAYVQDGRALIASYQGRNYEPRNLHLGGPLGGSTERL